LLDESPEYISDLEIRALLGYYTT